MVKHILFIVQSPRSRDKLYAKHDNAAAAVAAAAYAANDDNINKHHNRHYHHRHHQRFNMNYYCNARRC